VTSLNTLRKLASPLLYATRAYEKRWNQAAQRESFTLVLVYHRVVPDQTSRAGRFDIERGMPASIFEQQIQFLRKHFTPIKPSQVTEAATQPMRFAVTLDDGYEDNFTVAAPIMRRLGVSAGFYVVNDYVGTERLFWWEKLAHIVRASRAPELDLAAALPELTAAHGLPPKMSLTSDAQCEQAYERLSAALRAEPHGAIALHLEHLGNALEARPREEGRDYGLMDWAHLKELIRQGFEIGGHTATHCNLAGVAPTTLGTEITAAIENTQSRLDEPVLTFAYPYGRSHHFDAFAEKAVEAAGCRAGFTTVEGAARPSHRAFALPRLRFNRPFHFACAYNVQNALAKK